MTTQIKIYAILMQIYLHYFNMVMFSYVLVSESVNAIDVSCYRCVLLDWTNNNLNCMKQDAPCCKNIALCNTDNSCFVHINVIKTLKIIYNKNLG